MNLIGEHTDYNAGFCLPLAIDRAVVMAGRARDDGQVRVRSLEQPAPAEFALEPGLERVDGPAAWSSYVRGPARVLLDDGVPLRGCDLLLTSDVPLGAGLSSSAALQVAALLALLRAAGVSRSALAVARLAQRSENLVVGVPCGILDPLASACARAGHALLLDCRAESVEHVPLPATARVVIADTGTRRGLVDGAYRARREQCAAGAAALGVAHLRDVDLHTLHTARAAGTLDASTFARCAHVVAENGRTLAAAACLRQGDLPALGALMDQSHADLRDRFEVSCAELDAMVAAARALPGCYGSRMTGAGFGGCAVSLVAADAVDAFVPALQAAYAEAAGRTPPVLVTAAAAGACG